MKHDASSPVEMLRRPPVTRRVLRDIVYDALLDMLLDGSVTPGQSLGIENLSRSLNVSPTPVREALAELEHTGLVKRVALRGYTVSEPLGSEQMAELFTARQLVEVGAVRTAVPLGVEELDDLVNAHERHARAAEQMLTIDTGTQPASANLALIHDYYNADWAFHLVLLENCHNRYQLDIGKSLSPHLHRMRQTTSNGRNDALQAHREHQMILDAIRYGDADAAADAMAQHLAAARARTLEDF